MSRQRIDVEGVLDAAWGELGQGGTRYQRWYGMPGSAWCAMFFSWSQATGDHPIPVTTSKGAAYVPDWESWAKRNGSWVPANIRPQRGWGIVFSFGGRRADHIGRVLGVLPDGRIHTIEGNTGKPGRVKERFRSRYAVLGYVAFDDAGGKPASVPKVLSDGGIHPNSPATEIRLAQQILNYIRFWSHKPGIREDGIYGDETKAAVGEFQTAHNKVVPGALHVTDDIDNATLRAMVWWYGRLRDLHRT